MTGTQREHAIAVGTGFGSCRVRLTGPACQAGRPQHESVIATPAPVVRIETDLPKRRTFLKILSTALGSGRAEPSWSECPSEALTKGDLTCRQKVTSVKLPSSSMLH